jgi:hypothetical protein
MDNDAREAYYDRITTPGYKSDYQKAAEAWAEYRNHRDEYNQVSTYQQPPAKTSRCKDNGLINEMKKYQKIFGLRK